tara:strand:- start:1297 stop:2172 length:876 start_codon:yes stop_codon:yes gene_type:complete
MNNKFFKSDFAKKCRFHWDFISNHKDLERWNILSDNFNISKNREEKENNRCQIPKIIHQIWIGPKSFPQKYADWAKTWKLLNPSWEYKLWTEKELNNLNFINRNYFDNSKNIGFKSDLARYEVLNLYGGLYLDTDFECINPIPNYLLDYEFVSCVVFKDTPEIANGMMMSKKGAKIIKNLIRNIKKPSKNPNPINIIESSGAINLTSNYYHLDNEEKQKCLILPSNYFYPYPNFLLGKSIDIYDLCKPYTIGLHHWEMSWIKGSYLKRIIRKSLKLLMYWFKLLKLNHLFN